MADKNDPVYPVNYLPTPNRFTEGVDQLVKDVKKIPELKGPLAIGSALFTSYVAGEADETARRESRPIPGERFDPQRKTRIDEPGLSFLSKKGPLDLGGLSGSWALEVGARDLFHPTEPEFKLQMTLPFPVKPKGRSVE